LENVRSDCSKSSHRWNSSFFDGVNPEMWYKNNKFDRGHLSPRCDFEGDLERKMTFCYINAAPQNISLNRGGWRDLEVYARSNATKKVAKVITGTYDTLETFGGISVPKNFFKILVFCDRSFEIYVGVNYGTRRSANDVCLPVACSWRHAQTREDIMTAQIYCCGYNATLIRSFGLTDKELKIY
jgi:hypothetical protein